MKKILITGGMGFIGSNLIEQLLENSNYYIINIDKMSYAANRDFAKKIVKNKRHLHLKIDIFNLKKLSQVFEKYNPKEIIHLAAETHVDNSIIGSSNFINSNIIGTYNMLECSRKLFLKQKNKGSFKFIHVSTDEVFGDLKKNEKTFTENSKYKPSSPYSASKASSDHLVRAWQRTYNLPTIISNCSNNYGPRQHKEKLIPVIIHNALRGKPIPIFDKGQQIRDWLFVEDHVEALLCILEKGKIGETYNIGSNNEIKNIDLVKLICNELELRLTNDTNKKYNLKSLITFVKDRPGHDFRYSINNNKIKKELGWRPKMNFKKGIKKTVDWYYKEIKFAKNK